MRKQKRYALSRAEQMSKWKQKKQVLLLQICKKKPAERRNLMDRWSSHQFMSTCKKGQSTLKREQCLSWKSSSSVKLGSAYVITNAFSPWLLTELPHRHLLMVLLLMKLDEGRSCALSQIEESILSCCRMMNVGVCQESYTAFRVSLRNVFDL